MSISYAKATTLVQDVLGSSRELNDLGYSTAVRESTGETPTLPATFCVSLRPSPDRTLAISFCYQREGNHYFIVEITNNLSPDSFLLDEWMKMRGECPEPFPWMLSSYHGTLRERLEGVVSFLVSQLTLPDIQDILRGQSWEHIPYDWGE